MRTQFLIEVNNLSSSVSVHRLPIKQAVRKCGRIAVSNISKTITMKCGLIIFIFLIALWLSLVMGDEGCVKSRRSTQVT